ncbi:MAG: glycosyltransferase [Oscillospiraceae bacterium]|nr:glycosyltransferase [Oscillospiraceae bacterium]
MPNSKIKIFLGGYVNFPNAQNINCDNLARHLDKDKFEVHTAYAARLRFCKGQFPKVDRAWYNAHGIHLHGVFSHRFLWYWCKLLTMLCGNYDILYLPKAEKPDRHAARLLRGRAVTVASVEGVVTDSTNNSSEYRSYYMEEVDSFFAISRCIAESVKEKWGVDPPVLPLGVDPPEKERACSDKIKKVIWVGNIKQNKRPLWLVECAQAFPELSFLMLGDGDMEGQVKDEIACRKLENIVLYGRVPNSEVYKLMQKRDLLLMTSEYEGLPKVIQEAAACSVPSIYVDENYSVDFIRSGVNGFAVAGLDEMKEKLQWLLDYPAEYQKMSEEAAESIRPYFWPNLIRQYEEYFISLVRE